MGKFCGNCGAPLQIDSLFCTECGKVLAAPPVQPVMTPPFVSVQKKPSGNNKALVIVLSCLIVILVLALVGFFIHKAIVEKTPPAVPQPSGGTAAQSSPVETPTAQLPDNGRVNTAATLSDFTGLWKGAAFCEAVTGIEESRQALLDIGASEEDIDLLKEGIGTQSQMTLSIKPSGAWAIYLPAGPGVLDIACEDLLTSEERAAGQQQNVYISPRDGQFSMAASSAEEEGTGVFNMNGTLLLDGMLEGELVFGMTFSDNVIISYTFTFALNYDSAIDEDGNSIVEQSVAPTEEGILPTEQPTSQSSSLNINGQYIGQWYEGGSADDVIMDLEQSGAVVSLSIRLSSDGFRLFEYAGEAAVYDPATGKLYIDFGDGTDISLQFYTAGGTIVCEGNYNTYSGPVSVWLSRTG